MEWITIPEASEIAGITVEAIRAAVRKGKLEHRISGKRQLLNKKQVQAYEVMPQRRTSPGRPKRGERTN